MLPTTAQFDSAADANTTEVDCIVEIEREFNTIADAIVVSANDDPIDERFHKDNVVNVRNPQRNGIAYGPMSDFFTSDNPLSGFRAIPSDDFDQKQDVAYYIPQDSGTSKRVDLTVDYQQNYIMNAIELRYENTRTTSTFFDDTIRIYITPDGGGETQIYTGTMNNDGVTRIYYDGAGDWSENKTDLVYTGENIRSIRVTVTENTYQHHPRIMYFGGLNIADVSSDIIDLTVNKTEFEQSAYLPIGEPSGNTCSFTLDNTQTKYRFGNTASDYFIKNQRVTVKFGVNTKYGGGADAYEYVTAGVFYVDTYGYNEEDMTASVECQDRSKFLQEKFCGNYVWVDKSLKFIVHDVLSRSGITPRGVTFDFGVAANADESNKRQYTWSHDEQTVWDFLSELAKSELGTVFYDEEENLVFTDRLDIDVRAADGVQYSINETKNLVSMNEDFVIGANKVKVHYETLALNSSKINPQVVYGANNVPEYVSGPEVSLNQTLWQPDANDSYLGSAILSRTLKPSDTYIYLSKGTELQITREDGEVLIGDEFIQYKDRRTMGNGEGRLTIVKRNARRTTYQGQIPVHRSWQSASSTEKVTLWDRSKSISVNRNLQHWLTEEGFRQRMRTTSANQLYAIRATGVKRNDLSWTGSYRIYGLRFRFNEMQRGYRSDQIAGLFINRTRTQNNMICFEISKPSKKGLGKVTTSGNVRAYKTSDYLNTVPMPPTRTDREGNDVTEAYFDTIPFEEKSSTSGGTWLDITVIQVPQSGGDEISWYVNGNYINTFRTQYGYQTLRNKGYSVNQSTVGSRVNEKGRFGFFTRGGTDMTVDFIYAANNTNIGPDELLQSRGFNKYFDAGSDSWHPKREYFEPKLYEEEFGSPVHEVATYDGTHDVFPALQPRVMNTDEESVTVFKTASTPFTTKMVVGNTSRIGVNLNDTVYYPDGTQLNHSFLVYGVPIVEAEVDEIETSDAKSIRRYGVEEVEIENPWINSRGQAIALAKYIKRFWADQQEFWTAEIMPNPALQVRDRVSLAYPDKGFDGTDVWFVNGITLNYDGGLSASVKLRRFEDYPPNNDLDYRDSGDII